MKKLRVILAVAAVFSAAGLFAAVPAERPLRLVAHRGENRHAPENTLLAFELAWKDPAVWAVEADLCITKDKKVVCFHGPMKKITGTEDRIWRMTLAEVKALDVGRWKGEKFAGTRIPTLAEALKVCPPDKKFVLELKIPASDAFCKEFKQAMKESGVKPEQIIFISFSLKTMEELQKKLPGYPRLWLYNVILKDGKPSKTQDELLEIMKTYKLTGLNLGVSYKLRDQYMSKEFIKRIHDAGGEAWFFVINGGKLARQLYQAGADGITSDRCDELYKAVMDPAGK